MSKPGNRKRVAYLIFNLSPSSVVRGTVFAGQLEAAGFEAVFLPLFVPFLDKVEACFAKLRLGALGRLVRGAQKVASALLRRRFLARVRDFDGIIVVKNTTPAFLAQIKARSRILVLYDFDDAIWLDSFFMGEKVFRGLVAGADYVSCDNQYLADRVAPINPNVFLLNGPSQIELFQAHDRRENPSRKPFITIGWLGSPSTMFYLYKIFDELEIIGAKSPEVELVIAGSGHHREVIPPFEKIRVRCIPTYDQAAMIAIVSSFDVALYPLFDNDLSRGRGCLKATIYMSAGVPVVASAVGDNVSLIGPSGAGFVATLGSEWVDALSRLIENEDLRKSMGREALALGSRFSVQACFEQLDRNFLSKL